MARKFSTSAYVRSKEGKKPIRHQYDGSRVRVLKECKDDRTKQSFKDECDIDNILKQFKRTGLVTHVSSRPPQFMDVSEVPDYQTALDNVIETGKLFMQLDAETRKRFDNEPSKFLDFCVDPGNEDELRKLGLLPSVEAPAGPVEPAPVEPAPVVEPTSE